MRMRYGFTTGSCAAAASKAAAYMLLTGKKKETISIVTPKGIVFEAKLLEITRKEKSVSCAVEKDGGDDPDITTGALVYAEVSYTERSKTSQTENSLQEEKQTETTALHATVEIDGGIGVGRVTRPGMDQPIGNAAINHVPRQMIESEVLEVCRMADYKGDLKVIISIPKGVELAEKTFNPRLGIVGGISVLGTSGVVEPMSSQALLDTIRLELNMRHAQNSQVAAVSPGNYGLDFMKETYGYDLDDSVKCSNFIGETIDMAVECGFSKMLLTGHIGKLRRNYEYTFKRGRRSNGITRRSWTSLRRQHRKLTKNIRLRDNNRGNRIFRKREQDKACHGLSDGKNYLLYE